MDVPVYTQKDRRLLLSLGNAMAYRKRSRVIAIQLNHEFIVETDRGPMTAQAGDWLVTNHPDDDPGSDLWSISDARMRETYELADER